MNWLDTVLAVPLIGLRPVRNWRRSLRYADLIEPIVRKIESTEDVDLAAVKADGSSNLTLERTDGLVYKLFHDNINVQFQYRFIERSVPGEPKAYLEQVSPTRTFSESLSMVSEAMIELLDCLSEQGDPLLINRVGVVAMTRVKPSDVPPGVQSWIDTFDQPWFHPLRKIEASMLALLRDHDDAIDQCHYRALLDRTASDPELNLVMDWQRLLAEPRSIDTKEIIQCVKTATTLFNRASEVVGGAA
ncbi:MAG TPA: hypothetical protein RMH85_17140 [Polyangiaceae bacterium LLY-WYZ-15_(1-7)]|nr:hypothetical protein [Polyangiaceae bacterium LLY-WYZ-15_(1-7)]HJL10228.1 hypothetical protein [Polyangiaceae bacterium LLY-WYZ-15_(1-7)]HJL20727.1 hypothetical protein [Polyangiaceae bacterium LLY-WYZ-15_(1-7)]HJL38701.1 hypothetical protein [Polyangiaceae bacterium LLY-WYZ-15_(1-7)]HJL49608.1 hypothetical protein [Polyangiaceae bacterium LLY-WYZ-15_(1-7)]